MIKTKKKTEEVGFGPTEPLRAQEFSRLPQSTTLPFFLKIIKWELEELNHLSNRHA